MKIEHLAIWVNDLEDMKLFYQKYFDAKAGEKYFNPKKNFESYFLSFEGECRLEIMKMPGVPGSVNDIYKQFTGLIHFALSVGNKSKVDSLTELLRKDGYEVVGEPRTTGDGYYESVVLDPEGNRIEITE
ncbi:VOC family protein [Chryseosolibacter indicus]|uniref:VOC family protein n=1 Tax=Chryseosolibacter indicus TaxID=2782351 RepID=A0ABS5VX93_9BACT|nr:VOC family protein [Chryseosolibacter indicus]MBT1705509.1 VOC family protein [Chryseosolibacter indicus]